MLKEKLRKQAANKIVAAEQNINNNCGILITSNLFNTSLWQNVFNWECRLNEELRPLKPDGQITHIYNPVEYAAHIHCEYLRKFLKGTKKLLFIGMNPGHDGMGQTGTIVYVNCGFLDRKYMTMAMNKNETEEFWSQFYNLEMELNEKLKYFQKSPEVTHIYNPIEYTSAVHCSFLRKYLKGQKKVLFIGLNPGPCGMVQTGVPFGNISTVRTMMALHGVVGKPPIVHPKRPVNGLESTREEPSGKRLWTLFEKVANGSIDTFFEQCFVHNFCPLAFFNSNGNNITPSELKGPYKKQIRDTCLDTNEQILKLIQPEIIVAVGNYVYETFKKSEYCKSKRLLLLAHPSPRSLNNHNWAEKAGEFLIKEDLIKYLKNEITTT